jgi:hypothetical protein
VTYRLGIDVGSQETAWAVDRRDARQEPSLSGGLVASVVGVVGGQLAAGEAVTGADPADVQHLTGDFAGRLGDAEPLMIGGTPYGIDSLVGHLMASIVSLARNQFGSEPGAVLLVHDAGLDEYRTGLMNESARLAGIPLADVVLVSRTEADEAANEIGGTVPTGLGSVAGAAAIGWIRRPDAEESDDDRAAAVLLGSAAGAAGAAAVVAGGAVLGATVLGGEAVAAGPVAAGVAGLGPTGSPLAMPTAGPAGSPLAAPSAGPTGTPLTGPTAGPTGTPLTGPSAGPTGTPLTGPSAGPTGTPLPDAVTKTAKTVAKKSRKIPIVAASIAAVGLIAAVGVMAAGSDDPEGASSTTTPVIDEPSGESVQSSSASESDSGVSDGAPVVVTEAPTTTESPTTTAPAGPISGIACTVGSWTMENDSFAAMWLAAADAVGAGAILVGVNGTVVVDVGADGVWTSTYSDWGFTASAEDVTMTMSITGDDKSAGTFGDDGSFTFVDSNVNTVITATVSAGGVNLPIPQQTDTGSAFSGAGSFTCEGDTMTVSVDRNPGPIVMNRSA